MDWWFHREVSPVNFLIWHKSLCTSSEAVEITGFFYLFLILIIKIFITSAICQCMLDSVIWTNPMNRMSSKIWLKNEIDNWLYHGDIIKWKYFPRYWPFVRGIRRSPVKSQHKGQWRGVVMFSVICAWINGWVNNGEARDLRRIVPIMTSLWCPTEML